jgi:pimeloyl-ACP methyl ester carboxylesterase
MRRWVKILLALLAGLIALLIVNAIVISNETKDAHVNVDGAQLIETSNGTLQVLDEGNPDGSPVVLIHGYATSMGWWDKLAPLLTDKHRVIRVDLLGHGGSEKPKAGYSMEDQANAIALALGQLKVSDATIVGHSLGASVATALAEQSPEIAPRVVDIDQAPDDSYGELSFTAKLGYVPVIGQALNRLTDIAPDSVVRDQYKQAFAPGFSIASAFEDPDQPVEDLREMTYTSFNEVADAESDYSGDRPLNERLSSAQVPLLVIFGTEDQIYDDVDKAIDAYADIAGARTELIDGAGHSPQVEEPEQTAALIEDFIAQTQRHEAKLAAAEQRRQAAAQARRKAAKAAKATAAAAAAAKRAQAKKKAPAGA